MHLHCSLAKTYEYAYPQDNTYASWVEQLQHPHWQEMKILYAASVQFSLLRALTILGIACDKWPLVFSQLISLADHWSHIGHLWFQERKVPDLEWFVQQVVKPYTYMYQHMPTRYDWQYLSDTQILGLIASLSGPRFECHYPVVYPVWLLDYSYSQRQYIQDLGLFWTDLLSEYYRPWPGTIIGTDTASVATIKKLGKQARQEVGALFDLVSGHVEGLDVYPDAAQGHSTIESDRKNRIEQ